MKIEIVKMGKCRYLGLAEVAEEYIKRMQPFVSVDFSLWKESDSSAKLMRLFKSEHFVVCLDEAGKQMASVTFSKKMETWIRNPSLKKIFFVIGGPYGLPEEAKKKSQFLWSLSEGTLPSDLSWVIVCEQIYRAFTIQKGMAYHHE